MNDWLRVTAIGGDDYECRMTVLKADDTTITVFVLARKPRHLQCRG